MYLSRNAAMEPIAIKAVEGESAYGGDLLVKPLIIGEQMTFLEVRYAPGVGVPLHVHSHETIIYVVRGSVRTTVGGEEHVLGAGDACRHPKGVLHTVESIDESLVVEIKSPALNIESFLVER